jgi:hypothetical protein
MAPSPPIQPFVQKNLEVNSDIKYSESLATRMVWYFDSHLRFGAELRPGETTNPQKPGTKTHR